MESVRKILLWRLENMWPLDLPRPTPNLHCLPDTVYDPFGRPILLIEVMAIKTASDTFKLHIIQTFERLRCHLKRLNDGENPGPRLPILQYVILLDLKSLSFRDFNIELLSWVLRDIVPRFPGMLAGVFMLNYSWAHAGLWNIIKRVLPQSALSRVFFPTQQELMQYFTPSSLPKDYGGNLPALARLNDPLRSREALSSRRQNQPYDLPPAYQPPVTTTSTSLSPTSLLNPFFGYPVSLRNGLASLQHGRRRKRDLAQTLAFLFWIRWRKLFIGLLLVICAFAVRSATRRKLLYFLKGAVDWIARLSLWLSHWLVYPRRR